MAARSDDLCCSRDDLTKCWGCWGCDWGLRLVGGRGAFLGTINDSLSSSSLALVFLWEKSTLLNKLILASTELLLLFVVVGWSGVISSVTVEVWKSTKDKEGVIYFKDFPASTAHVLMVISVVRQKGVETEKVCKSGWGRAKVEEKL